ncbi:Similar to kinesin, putative [Aspergillus flavus NRRL3357]; acc. no. XP_002374699 [Pyronema omphalodes CBS 100304]|uniref:Similar to kinesin, putative [Aspergillus flavus NRRL3357] acc. no. XP_002374699 n=1 Tax=Pyronema omphalodes (strain CBS 100304) TaxID=1076935 RepID=U4LIB0_PYROM|nr:Similar to kinesin, putative [Aspergillus flavus NRRL3357]; acc. no. XP_002374699 [Pyronema omphalodes CBS 100304]
MVLAIQRRVFGKEHPDTIGRLEHQAFVYRRQERRKEAEDIGNGTANIGVLGFSFREKLR